MSNKALMALAVLLIYGGNAMAIEEPRCYPEESYRENEKILLRALQEAGLKPVGEAIYARYNPPFHLWFLRRNEVLIPVQRETAVAAKAAYTEVSSRAGRAARMRRARGERQHAHGPIPSLGD